MLIEKVENLDDLSFSTACLWESKGGQVLAPKAMHMQIKRPQPALLPKIYCLTRGLFNKNNVKMFYMSGERKL